MSLTAAEVAALVGGEVVGEPATRLEGVAPLERAGPRQLSFLADARHLPAFRTSRAGVVLCSPAHRAVEPGPLTRIVVEHPQRALVAVLRALHPEPVPTPGLHSTVVLGPGVRLGEDVTLGPYVVLGRGVRLGDRVRIGAGSVIGEGVTIGDDVTIHPLVVCYPGTRVGSRVILHAGVRLGVDGFGYVSGPSGHERIPHAGRCIIGDDVEIGANSTVDRGSVDDTVIGPGCKLDNLVHVAHNVRLGARCLLLAQVGVAGSAQVGDDVILAGQAGLSDHVVIGAQARVGGQAGVIGDVAPGRTVSGFPARDHRAFMRATAALYRLSKIVDRLESLVERGDAAGTR